MTRLTRLTAATTAICLAVGTPALTKGSGNGNKPQERRVAQVREACPPGLARKSPRCLPPGQARKAAPEAGRDGPGLRVGSSLQGRDYIIVRSWQYGLEPAPPGSRYAVYDGMLVRIDETTAEVLNLIRAVGAIVD